MAETRSPNLPDYVLDALRDRYGAVFVEKASDEFLRSLATQRLPGPAAPMAMTEGFAAAVPGPASTVIEFEAAAEAPEAVQASPEALERAQSALSELGSGLEGLALSASMVLRRAAVQASRDRFHHTSGPLTQEIERQLVSVFAARSESLAPASGPVAATETCWLNRTVRARPVPEALAEVAAASEIRRIDVPRRLTPEALVLGDAVGAAAFRTATRQSGKGVIVAVIDSEVPTTHPALHRRVSQKGNYTREPWGSPNRHGTGVAGIIAADGEVVGVAPGATLYSYKVFASNPSLHADDFGGALAVQQALEDGAHIANCSWGAGPAGDGTSREARAFDAAWQLGMVLVKSAGNGGPGPGTLTSPADAAGVIVVGATDQHGQAVQFFSSRGPLPNGERRPHVVAPGGTATPPETIVEPVVSCLPDGGVGSLDDVGTSFAAPQVTGLLALLIEAHPNDSPDQLRNRLFDLCRPLGGGGSEDVQGRGLPVLSQT